MNYAALTIGSKSRLKRWSHGARFNSALAAVSIPDGARILDYGTGEAYLLSLIAAHHSSAELWGFDPMLADQARETVKGSARIIEDRDALPASYFDIIFCMEVLEHLRPDLREEVVTEIVRTLAPGGTAVISVPIETGMTAIVKNAARFAAGARHKGSVKDILRSALRRPVARVEQDDYIPSHIGFDYHVLPPLFAKYGLIQEWVGYSPMPILRGVVNSQITYRLRKR